MNQRMANQTLALAGAMHACWLVRQLAHQGSTPSFQFECAIRPIFELDPESVEAVYGEPECRHDALTVLRSQLGSGSAARDMEVTRYTATLIHLERKLVARRDLMAALRDGIEHARAQVDYFGLTHENTLARLADLYSRTVSTLRPQVMVQGDARFLNDPAVANRVRALLLAATRSVVLWRQCGGTRLRLIFQRNRLVEAATQLSAS